MAFLFVEVPDEARDVFEKVSVPGKREPRRKYHITILFLGDDVPSDDVLKASEAALEVTRKTASFQVSTRLVTSFPAGDDGVPIIARIESPELVTFQANVRKAFDDAGIGYSNRFPEYKPHMTLAYADAPPPDKSIPPVSWTVNQLIVLGGKEGDTKRVKTELPFERDVATALRVASRYQLAARPIHIDSGRITTEAYNLQTLLLQALKKLPQGKPLGVRRPFVKSLLDGLDDRNVMGGDVPAPTAYVGSAVTSSLSTFVGGSSQTPKGKPAVILLDLNGRRTPEELSRELSERTGMLEIRSLLLHEMTHVLDVQTDTGYQKGEESYGIDKAKYYNDPSEVRAFMQQIADDVLRYAAKHSRDPVPKSGPKLVQEALRSSPHWQQIKGHLNPKSTATILKGVYRAMLDAGLDIGGDDYTFLFSGV